MSGHLTGFSLVISRNFFNFLLKIRSVRILDATWYLKHSFGCSLRPRPPLNSHWKLASSVLSWSLSLIDPTNSGATTPTHKTWLWPMVIAGLCDPVSPGGPRGAVSARCCVALWGTGAGRGLGGAALALVWVCARGGVVLPSPIQLSCEHACACAYWCSAAGIGVCVCVCVCVTLLNKQIFRSNLFFSYFFRVFVPV